MALVKTNDTNRVIFIIDEANPTEDDLFVAEKIVNPVVFRNSRFISDDDAPEPCVGLAVSPDVVLPKGYKKIPRVDEKLWKELVTAKFKAKSENKE